MSEMGRELEWDDSIEKDSDYVILPEGDYEFVVESVERARHPGSEKLPSCNKAIVKLRIDKQYIRAGQSTTKTGTQRSFAVTGDRYVGDDAQDFCLSHAMKYGTGSGVVTNYIYFNILTGKGEKGQCSIIVNSDGAGNAGESSAVDIEFKKIGSNPAEYTYSAA